MHQLAAVLDVEEGRRGGSAETRVTLNYGLPSPREVDAYGGIDKRERWRLRTATQRIPTAIWSGDRAALEVWNRARDEKKGRALIAADQQDDGAAAVLMSWHYDDRERGGRRPHLITSIVLRDEPGLFDEDLIAAWLLCLVGLAIDRRTTKRGRVGLVIDNGIALELGELGWLGWEKGPQADGYRGDYFVLTAVDR